MKLGNLLGLGGAVVGGIYGGGLPGAAAGMGLGQAAGGLLQPEEQKQQIASPDVSNNAISRRLEANNQSQLSALGQGLQAMQSPGVPDYVRQAAQEPLQRALALSQQRRG